MNLSTIINGASVTAKTCETISKEARNWINDAAKNAIDKNDSAINNQIKIAKTKADIIFKSCETVSKVAKDISGVVVSNRESMAKSEKIYADIENNRKELDLKIKKQICDSKNEVVRLQEEIRKSIESDGREKEKIEKKYKLEFEKMDCEYKVKMSEISNLQEKEMLKEQHNYEIEKMKAEKEAQKIDAEIRRYDADTERVIMATKAIEEKIRMQKELFELAIKNIKLINETSVIDQITINRYLSQIQSCQSLFINEINGISVNMEDNNFVTMD